MNNAHQDISLSLPIRMKFKTLTNFINKSYAGHTISKTNSHGKETSYFEIRHINVQPSDVEKYNIELILNLETLTTFYNHRELEISIFTLVKLDVITQKIYVDSYKMESKGQGWIADHLIKSILNTFIYEKMIKNLNYELVPLIDEKLQELNLKLASKLEVQSGISVLGALNSLRITHFEIRDNTLWIIISLKGWGVVDIENLAF